MTALFHDDEWTPPAAWFRLDDLPEWFDPTWNDGLVQIGPDGRVIAQVAPYGECILMGGTRECVFSTPESPTGYEFAHVGAVRTAEGDIVRVGNVGGGVGHYNPQVATAMTPAQEHYANTATRKIVGRYYDRPDLGGIILAGAMWPGTTAEDRVLARASALSGDWRWVHSLNAYDMSGSQLVNNPGFRPSRYVPRAHALVASLDDSGNEQLHGVWSNPDPLTDDVLTDLIEGIHGIERAFTTYLSLTGGITAAVGDLTIDGEPLTGANIILVPDDPDAVAHPDGDPPEVLHVTLKFLGDADRWGPTQREEVERIVGEWAAQRTPYEATVTGVGQLGDDGEATVLHLDAPNLAVDRDALSVDVDQLTLPDTADKYPAYKPHLTVGYHVAAPEAPPETVALSKAAVQWGPERVEFPLGVAHTAAAPVRTAIRRARAVVPRVGRRDLPGENWRHDYHDPTTGQFAPLGYVSPRRLLGLLSGPDTRTKVLAELREQIHEADEWVDAYVNAGPDQRAHIARKVRDEVIGPRPTKSPRQMRAWDLAQRAVAEALAAARKRPVVRGERLTAPRPGTVLVDGPRQPELRLDAPPLDGPDLRYTVEQIRADVLKVGADLDRVAPADNPPQRPSLVDVGTPTVSVIVERSTDGTFTGWIDAGVRTPDGGWYSAGDRRAVEGLDDPEGWARGVADTVAGPGVWVEQWRTAAYEPPSRDVDSPELALGATRKSGGMADLGYVGAKNMSDPKLLAEMERLSTENPDRFYRLLNEFGPVAVWSKGLPPYAASQGDGYWKAGKFRRWTKAQLRRNAEHNDDSNRGGDGGAIIERERKARAKARQTRSADLPVGSTSRRGGVWWVKVGPDRWRHDGQIHTDAEMDVVRGFGPDGIRLGSTNGPEGGGPVLRSTSTDPEFPAIDGVDGWTRGPVGVGPPWVPTFTGRVRERVEQLVEGVRSEYNLTGDVDNVDVDLWDRLVYTQEARLWLSGVAHDGAIAEDRSILQAIHASWLAEVGGPDVPVAVSRRADTDDPFAANELWKAESRHPSGPDSGLTSWFFHEQATDLDDMPDHRVKQIVPASQVLGRFGDMMDDGEVIVGRPGKVQELLHGPVRLTPGDVRFRTNRRTTRGVRIPVLPPRLMREARDLVADSPHWDEGRIPYDKYDDRLWTALKESSDWVKQVATDGPTDDQRDLLRTVFEADRHTYLMFDGDAAIGIHHPGERLFDDNGMAVVRTTPQTGNPLHHDGEGWSGDISPEQVLGWFADGLVVVDSPQRMRALLGIDDVTDDVVLGSTVVDRTDLEWDGRTVPNDNEGWPVIPSDEGVDIPVLPDGLLRWVADGAYMTRLNRYDGSRLGRMQRTAASILADPDGDHAAGHRAIWWRLTRELASRRALSAILHTGPTEEERAFFRILHDHYLSGSAPDDLQGVYRLADTDDPFAPNRYWKRHSDRPDAPGTGFTSWTAVPTGSEDGLEIDQRSMGGTRVSGNVPKSQVLGRFGDSDDELIVARDAATLDRLLHGDDLLVGATVPDRPSVQLDENGLPPLPGTVTPPPGAALAYHYTRDLDSVLAEGVLVERALGHTYGEPNMVWASFERPSDYKDYVEFWVRPADMDIGRPLLPEHFDAAVERGANFTVRGDVSPDRFTTWHNGRIRAARTVAEYDSPEFRRDVADGLYDDTGDPDLDAALDLYKRGEPLGGPDLRLGSTTVDSLVERIAAGEDDLDLGDGTRVQVRRGVGDAKARSKWYAVVSDPNRIVTMRGLEDTREGAVLEGLRQFRNPDLTLRSTPAGIDDELPWRPSRQFTAEDIRRLAADYNADYPEALPEIEAGTPTVRVRSRALGGTGNGRALTVELGVIAPDGGWIGGGMTTQRVAARPWQWRSDTGRSDWHRSIAEKWTNDDSVSLDFGQTRLESRTAAAAATNADVYRNLHTGTWSVRDRSTGLVIDHPELIAVRDATFVVRPGGRERVREEGRKNVHAFVRGEVVDVPADVDLSTMRRVTYNPYTDDQFVDADTGEAILDAPYVYMDAQQGVYVPRADLSLGSTVVAPTARELIGDWVAVYDTPSDTLDGSDLTGASRLDEAIHDVLGADRYAEWIDLEANGTDADLVDFLDRLEPQQRIDIDRYADPASVTMGDAATLGPDWTYQPDEPWTAERILAAAATPGVPTVRVTSGQRTEDTSARFVRAEVGVDTPNGWVPVESAPIIPLSGDYAAMDGPDLRRLIASRWGGDDVQIDTYEFSPVGRPLRDALPGAEGDTAKGWRRWTEPATRWWVRDGDTIDGPYAIQPGVPGEFQQERRGLSRLLGLPPEPGDDGVWIRESVNEAYDATGNVWTTHGPYSASELDRLRPEGGWTDRMYPIERTAGTGLALHSTTTMGDRIEGYDQPLIIDPDVDRPRRDIWVQKVCPRCAGTGGYSHWPGFTCFRCRGVGTIARRGYRFPEGTTEADAAGVLAEYQARLDRQADRRRERRAAEARDQFAQNVAAWPVLDDIGEAWDQAEERMATDYSGGDVPPMGPGDFLPPFVRDVYLKAHRYPLSERQGQALARAFADAEASAARYAEELAAGQRSEWVGDIGDKLTTTATLKHRMTVDTRYGTSVLAVLEDDTGNRYKVFGTSRWLWDAEVGERYALSGTVKEHDTYEGVKQTVLTRTAGRPPERLEVVLTAPSTRPARVTIDLNATPDGALSSTIAAPDRSGVSARDLFEFEFTDDNGTPYRSVVTLVDGAPTGADDVTLVSGILVDDDDRPAGYFERALRGDTVEMSLLSVNSNHTGKGVGGAFVDESLRRAGEAGWSRAEVFAVGEGASRWVSRYTVTPTNAERYRDQLLGDIAQRPPSPEAEAASDALRALDLSTNLPVSAFVDAVAPLEGSVALGVWRGERDLRVRSAAPVVDESLFEFEFTVDGASYRAYIASGLYREYPPAADPARFVGGQIVDADGTDIGTFERLFHPNSATVEFTMLRLKPEHRGKGIGGAFVDESMDRLAAAGWQKVVVEAESRPGDGWFGGGRWATRYNLTNSSARRVIGQLRSVNHDLNDDLLPLDERVQRGEDIPGSDLIDVLSRHYDNPHAALMRAGTWSGEADLTSRLTADTPRPVDVRWRDVRDAARPVDVRWRDVRDAARSSGGVTTTVVDTKGLRRTPPRFPVEVNYHNERYGAMYVTSPETGRRRKWLVRWERLEGVHTTVTPELDWEGESFDAELRRATPLQVSQFVRDADRRVVARIGDNRLSRSGLTAGMLVEVEPIPGPYGEVRAVALVPREDGTLRRLRVRWDRFDAVVPEPWEWEGQIRPSSLDALRAEALPSTLYENAARQTAPGPSRSTLFGQAMYRRYFEGVRDGVPNETLTRWLDAGDEWYRLAGRDPLPISRPGTIPPPPEREMWRRHLTNVSPGTFTVPRTREERRDHRDDVIRTFDGGSQGRREWDVWVAEAKHNPEVDLVPDDEAGIDALIAAGRELLPGVAHVPDATPPPDVDERRASEHLAAAERTFEENVGRVEPMVDRALKKLKANRVGDLVLRPDGSWDVMYQTRDGATGRAVLTQVQTRTGPGKRFQLVDPQNPLNATVVTGKADELLAHDQIHDHFTHARIEMAMAVGELVHAQEAVRILYPDGLPGRIVEVPVEDITFRGRAAELLLVDGTRIDVTPTTVRVRHLKSVEGRSIVDTDESFAAPPELTVWLRTATQADLYRRSHSGRRRYASQRGSILALADYMSGIYETADPDEFFPQWNLSGIDDEVVERIREAVRVLPAEALRRTLPLRFTHRGMPYGSKGWHEAGVSEHTIGLELNADYTTILHELGHHLDTALGAATWAYYVRRTGGLRNGWNRAYRGGFTDSYASRNYGQMSDLRTGDFGRSGHEVLTVGLEGLLGTRPADDEHLAWTLGMLAMGGTPPDVLVDADAVGEAAAVPVGI